MQKREHHQVDIAKFFHMLTTLSLHLVALFLAGGTGWLSEVIQPAQEDYQCYTGLDNMAESASKVVGGSLNGDPVVCGGLHNEDRMELN